jgi:iron complex outermembrane receptor protein
VNAVSSADIEKLNFQQFTDVQTVVPGLTMSSGATGYTTAASIRGASFQVESSASPTVEFYLNDAPIQSVFLFQSMFDIGQIEVLRGPQGTLRGRAAPSGSITVTTHQPDVSEFGGYVSALGTNENSKQAQGAVNIPLVQDKLALRVAGLYDDTDYDLTKSLRTGQKASSETKGGRVSLRWEATDSLTASLVYQRLDRDLLAFDAYESFSLANPAAAVVNTATNPLISPDQRLSILDTGRSSPQKFDIATANVDWAFGGQKLSYVGTYYKFDLTTGAPTDVGGVIAGNDVYNFQTTVAEGKAHELRLASEERLFGKFDYTIGVFQQNFSSPTDLTNKTIVGIPTGQFSLNVITVVDTLVGRRSGTQETAPFANLTYHLNDKTEFSGGVRTITFKTNSTLDVNGNRLSTINTKETPTVWNLAASHRFTDDFMVYGNVGTSWRDGPTAVGIFRPLTPRLTQFTDLKSEDSTSYELGFKASFLEQRLRLNLSAFHQDFQNYIYRGPSVWYVNIGARGAAPALFNFDASVDAKVNGAEFDVAYRATESLNLSLNFAYAKGEIKNGVVACNDFDGNGVPDQNPPASPTVAQILTAAGSTDPLVEAVAACRVNDRLSFAPKWTGTLQAEYTHPLPTAGLSAFGRGLYSFYPSNVNDPNNPYDNVDSYGLLNIYTGVRSDSGAWEVSLFARNITKTKKVLGLGNNTASGNAATSTAYTNALTGAGTSLAGPYITESFTAPREFGLSVRYAFGAR